ncbi:sensor histidine kinase [Streptomyces cavernae]|uniref:sensor histidine kinase n=1 Tax=Streptomyces cavernae TaxID=2259034 RepID=UPI00192E7135|nr:ATP-binding protein [Streptomyces cavernae]
MSHLRAPAARADRREGGRHGRPVVRTTSALPETHIRPQLLRIAVLPPVAVALSACAAVLFIVRSTTPDRPSPTLWAVLSGALGVTLAGILIAAFAADRAARSVRDRVGELRRTTSRGQADLLALVEALRHGEGPPVRAPRAAPGPHADEFDLLADDLARAHDTAVSAVVQAAQLSSRVGNEQKVEVFVNLARRLQSLVHREILILDELENGIEDPDLLKGLFHVDHLATRTRRHAENLAVLGGAVSRRQWSNPVSMTEVLRAATAEVEQYSRVKLVPPIEGTLRGHAVADVIHLLAELVENATVFSAPHTHVLLRTNLVTSGLAVEVEDRGLGMPVDEQHRMNALLADPDQVNVASLLQDGRIGLFVVSQLARRHGIAVRLQSNIYGGIQAVLVLPQELLGAASWEGPEPGNHPEPQQRPDPQQRPEARQRPEPGKRPEAERRLESGQRAEPRKRAEAGQWAEAGQRTEAGQRAEAGHRAEPGQRPQAETRTRTVRAAPLTGQAHKPLAGRVVTRDTHGDAPGPRRAVPSQADGSRPAPLPRRGAGQPRPNPAAATPGVRPEDRRVAAENAGMLLLPRNTAVHDATDKPPLPRRRAQEHLAPQLRSGPLSRPEDDALVVHDPGLMAAFQRGIGLAEAQPAASPHDLTGRHDHDLTGRHDLTGPHDLTGRHDHDPTGPHDLTGRHDHDLTGRHDLTPGHGLTAPHDETGPAR